MAVVMEGALALSGQQAAEPVPSTPDAEVGEEIGDVDEPDEEDEEDAVREDDDYDYQDPFIDDEDILVSVRTDPIPIDHGFVAFRGTNIDEYFWPSSSSPKKRHPKEGRGSNRPRKKKLKTEAAEDVTADKENADAAEAAPPTSPKKRKKNAKLVSSTTASPSSAQSSQDTELRQMLTTLEGLASKLPKNIKHVPAELVPTLGDAAQRVLRRQTDSFDLDDAFFTDLLGFLPFRSVAVRLAVYTELKERYGVEVEQSQEALLASVTAATKETFVPLWEKQIAEHSASVAAASAAAAPVSGGISAATLMPLPVTAKEEEEQEGATQVEPTATHDRPEAKTEMTEAITEITEAKPKVAAESTADKAGSDAEEQEEEDKATSGPVLPLLSFSWSLAPDCLTALHRVATNARRLEVASKHFLELTGKKQSKSFPSLDRMLKKVNQSLRAAVTAATPEAMRPHLSLFTHGKSATVMGKKRPPKDASAVKSPAPKRKRASTKLDAPKLAEQPVASSDAPSADTAPTAPPAPKKPRKKRAPKADPNAAPSSSAEATAEPPSSSVPPPSSSQADAPSQQPAPPPKKPRKPRAPKAPAAAEGTQPKSVSPKKEKVPADILLPLVMGRQLGAASITAQSLLPLPPSPPSSEGGNIMQE